MVVLSVCASKGGVGKTTLSACLAVAAVEDHMKVGLIDLDPQASLARWWELRGEPDNPQLITGIDDLHDAVEAVAEHGFDLIVIDTPPALMSKLTPAVEVSDFVLIPAQPSPLDVEAIDPVIELVSENGKAFAFVLNRASARTALAKGATTYLQEGGEVLDELVASRAVFAAAMTDGKSGPEVDKGKARKEINGLWRAVKKRLRKAGRKAA